MVYSATEFALFAETLLDRVEGFSRFIIPQTSCEAVVRILPDFTMLPQVNHHGDLLTFVIGDELNVLQSLSYQAA